MSVVVRDLRGQRFTRLVAQAVHGRDRQGRVMWLCVCDCGAGVVVPSRHLVNGAVRSCKCLAREAAAASGRKGADKISGPRSPRWKPELTAAERLLRRNLPETHEWRRQVFLRDDYTCVVCLRRGLDLCAHHLDCWALFPELRFAVENGVTLCAPHHDAFHEHMGGACKPCTRDDFFTWRRWYIDNEIEAIEKSSS